MNRTKIEWVKNPDGSQGYTWNPITGCLNGCPYCYARKLANGRLRERYLANSNVADISNRLRDPNSSLWDKVITDPFYPRLWPERLKEPVNKIRRWGRQSQVLHTQEPKGIFVCDMSDLFGIGIPEEWTKRVLDRFQYCPQHRFYLLTKQPQNLIKFSPFPENCWVGVTVTSFEYLGRALYIGLSRIEAKIKFISFEPLLGESQLKAVDLIDCGINWLIIGAQTKPYKPPQIEWVEEIVEAADRAGIPVFLKNNLWRGLVPKHGIPPVWARGRNGQDADCLRQELPK